VAKPVLQIIIGSTRPGRVGPAVADWIIDRARARGDFEVQPYDTVTETLG
jgi:NAD(P)H-dependent FMN reductase